MTSPSRPQASAPASRVSQHLDSPASGAWYRREPWLALLLLAFVPALGSLVVQDTARIVLLGATAVLAAVGLAVLVVQHRRDGASRPEWAETREESEDVTR
jgi:hypothetical protein